jgi:hypothetical protein
MKEGLVLAEKLGCNRVIIESDSLETIEAYFDLLAASFRRTPFLTRIPKGIFFNKAAC